MLYLFTINYFIQINKFHKRTWGQNLEITKMLILFNIWQMRKIQFESVVTVRGFRGCLKKC